MLAKFRETAFSVLPIMGIVLALGLAAVPREAAEPWWLARFVVGGAMLVAGLSAFLLGVDLGIAPFGERVGEALAKRRSLPRLVGAAALVGVVVTAAEPDVQVFAAQVSAAGKTADKTTLVLSIAVGVGLFMALGMLRSVVGLGLKPVLCAGYAGLLLLALAAPEGGVGVAFDAGGATTGPMTVPFVMALGLGVAATRAGRGGDGGFGLTGIASIGPVMAVLATSALSRGGAASASAAEAAHGAATLFGPFAAAARGALRDAAVSIAPLFALLAFFRLTILDMTPRQTARTSLGLLYALAGLAVFLLGVEGGFIRAGEILGAALGAKAAGSAWSAALLVATGAALGAIVVCAEPAVWVLGENVEEHSGGAIRRRTLLVFLAGATALAIALAMARAVAGFPLGAVLVPGYALAFALMAKTPGRWTAVAFDSGGVASGPLTTTFVLSFALGAASAASGGAAADPFGVVALVAMAPLVAIQWMGLSVERRRAKGRKGGTTPEKTP